MNLLKSLKFNSLLFPLLSTYMIVLNIYNGDILSIHANLEFMLLYIAPLTVNLYMDYKNNEYKKYINEYILYILGIFSNIYWYKLASYEINFNDRHRTEFYDTQCLLCSISFYTINERSKLLLKNE